MKCLFFQNYGDKVRLSDADLLNDELKLTENLDRLEHLINVYNELQSIFKIKGRTITKACDFKLSMDIVNEQLLKQNYKIIMNNERRIGLITYGIDLKLYIKFKLYRKILNDSMLQECLSRHLKSPEYNNRSLQNALLENQYLVEGCRNTYIQLNPELNFEPNSLNGKQRLKMKLMLQFSDILDVNLRTMVTQFSLHFKLINRLIIDGILRKFFNCTQKLNIDFVIRSLIFILRKIRSFFKLPNIASFAKDDEIKV